MTPLMLQDGDVVDCVIDWCIKASQLAWQTAGRPYQMTSRGQLGFQPDAPDNPRQNTLLPVRDEEA